MRSRTAMIFLGSCLLLSAACSSDTTSAPQTAAVAPGLAKSSGDVPNPYAWAGQYHNGALSFALLRIKASKKTSKLERCKVGLAALKDYQKQFRKPNGSVITVNSDVIDGMCEEASIFSVAASRLASAGLQNNISGSASDYMNQISAAVDYTSSLPAYSFAVNQIENNASNTLGDGSLETGAVYGTGAIGVSSEEYWIANEGSWTSGMPQPTVLLGAPSGGPQYQVGSRARRIIKADIAAAISTLLTDWWMGEYAIDKACVRAAAASLIAGLSLF